MHDVWDHEKLLKVVSHTPIEIDYLTNLKESALWIDSVRNEKNESKLYSWWSYRAKDWKKANKGRRLDHIWISTDLIKSFEKATIFEEARGWDKPSDHVPISTELCL